MQLGTVTAYFYLLVTVKFPFAPFIVDSVFVSRYCLPIQKINPLPLALIDGTINHLMNYVISLPIKFPCLYSCQTEFFVTKLEGSYPIVLGHNWLTQNNPSINWKKGTMVFSKTNPENWLINPQPKSKLSITHKTSCYLTSSSEPTQWRSTVDRPDHAHQTLNLLS